MRPFLAGILAIVAASNAPADVGTTDLRPVGPWKVDYGESSCMLSRNFSTGDQSFLLAVTFEPVVHLSWLRVGSTEQVKARDDGKATVKADGAELKEPIHFNIFPSQSNGAVREFMFTEFHREVGGAKRTVQLRLGKYGDLTFHLDDFPQAMGAADTCLAGLHRSLGIDPSILSKIAAEPEGTALSFVKYPRGEGGFDIKLLYWVTPEGRVEECRVLTPSGHRDFDASVCNQLQAKGKFKPARDRVGTAIRAPVYEDIRLRTATIYSSTPL